MEIHRAASASLDLLSITCLMYACLHKAKLGRCYREINLTAIIQSKIHRKWPCEILQFKLDLKIL